MKPVFKIFPEALNAIKQGKCPTCGIKIEGFRNESSIREYKISGMCQSCHDSVFGKD